MDARKLLRAMGISEREIWECELVTRFANEAPEEYERVSAQFCRQNGDPVKKMIAYAQRRLERLNSE